jgi:hypothetical protein
MKSLSFLFIVFTVVSFITIWLWIGGLTHSYTIVVPLVGNCFQIFSLIFLWKIQI